LYHRDQDRFSPSALVTEDVYDGVVYDHVARFGAIWVLKLYASQCHGCNAIAGAWERLVEEFAGDAVRDTVRGN
jgi:hypothetical protein